MTEAALVEAIAWMNGHAAPNFSFQVEPSASPAFYQELLKRNGLEKSADPGWAKFYRDGSPAVPHPG